MSLSRSGIVSMGALLCALLLPQAVSAQSGLSASCGSGTLTVAQGGSIPGPSQFGNASDAAAIFNVTMRANALFGAEHQVSTRLLEPGLGVNQPSAIPVPYSTATGTDRVVVDVTSPNTGTTILATCDYTVTVTVPYPDTITLPLRLCVLEGAGEADGGHYPRTSGNDLLPFSTYLTTQRTRVRELVQEASDKVWLPQAHIMFRIADAPLGIPVLPDRDLYPSADLKSTILGNVDAQSNGDLDQKDVATDCAAAWQQLYNIDKGIVLTIVHAYSWSNGEVGRSGTPDLRFLGGDTPLAWDPSHTGQDNGLCSQPRDLSVADVELGSITLIDPATPARDGGRSTGFITDLVTEIAHELGHDLMLGHGNGLDDNGDGLVPSNDGLSLSNPGNRRYDQYCDALGTKESNKEDPPTGQCEGLAADPSDPSSLMNAKETGCKKLWPLQVEQARAAAKLKPGAVTGSGDPSGELLLSRPCTALPCGISPGILTLKAEFAETPGLNVTTFVHTLFGSLDPSSTNAEYFLFADLDNNSTTGCSPSTIGLPTSFQGAEIVTRAHVLGNSVTPTAWMCAGGGLVALSDPNIRAKVSVHGSTSPNNVPPGLYRIVVEMPNSVRGPRSDYVRIQTLSRELDSPGSLFRIPAAADAGGVLSLVPGPGPECSPTPTGVQPGETLTVHGIRLSPQQTVAVFLGMHHVASGFSTVDGEASVTFVVPANTEVGTRQLTVSTQTGTMAVCALQVYGNASGPSTVATLDPQPNASGWHGGFVTLSLLASAGSNGASIRDLTYAASGAETIPSTTTPGNAVSFPIYADGVTSVAFAARDTLNSTEATESLTVKIDSTPPQITASRLTSANSYGWNNGAVAVRFSCLDQTSGVTSCPIPVIVGTEGADQTANGVTSDFAAHTASASVSGINIDLTPPVVNYSGSRADYTVDQTVQINCTATDSLSGLLTTTCQAISGPAYTFPLGTNTFSAAATDRADNRSTGQVSFTVRVTFESLCTLASRFSTKAGVANSLCSTLASASDAAARGQMTAKQGAMNAFKQDVAAQTGKALTSAFAATLLVLADGL